MDCPLCEVVRRARAGDHPPLIADLRESFAVLGDNQGCPGWTVLVLKEHAEHLADLPVQRQLRLWEDVADAAAAIRREFGPLRINYESLGNQVAHIHWHVIPRHRDDPDPRNPVWGWAKERLAGSMDAAARAALAARLRTRLQNDKAPPGLGRASPNR